MNNIELEIDQSVARIWLNRPELSNAFNDELIQELTELLVSIEKDESVRVIVLGGRGKHFCAGADMNWMRSMAEYSEAENQQDAQKLANLLSQLNFQRQPVIARCQGAAFGGGVGLLACCDMVVATDKSMFCLSEVRLGLTPATISPFVVEAIGARQARRYFLTAERFNSVTANQLGLVTIQASEEELDSQIEELIQHLLAGGPNAQADAKQLIQTVTSEPNFEAMQRYTVELIARQRVSEEGQDGLSAFLNKQKAGWIQ